MHTNAGNHTAALHAIDRARNTLAAPGLAPELLWFDYYDATRLHGFAGLTSGNGVSEPDPFCLMTFA